MIFCTCASRLKKKNRICFWFRALLPPLQTRLPPALQYRLKDLRWGISLAVAGNAPDDSRVCHGDLKALAGVLLSNMITGLLIFLPNI